MLMNEPSTWNLSWTWKGGNWQMDQAYSSFWKSVDCGWRTRQLNLSLWEEEEVVVTSQPTKQPSSKPPHLGLSRIDSSDHQTIKPSNHQRGRREEFDYCLVTNKEPTQPLPSPPTENLNHWPRTATLCEGISRDCLVFEGQIPISWPRIVSEFGRVMDKFDRIFWSLSTVANVNSPFSMAKRIIRLAMDWLANS